MKKNMLLIIFVVFLGCETGTRYDKNTTVQTLPKKIPQSGLVDRHDIEALLDDDKEEVLVDPYYDNKEYIDIEVREKEPKDKEHVESFSSGIITDGLDVKKIREGKHEGYIRLVFDIYNDSKAAKDVGHYDAEHSNSKKEISVILHGYRKFSASLPSFPYYSIIEHIHLEEYNSDSDFKFKIKLRKNAEVKIFDLKSPARIVFDIKPI